MKSWRLKNKMRELLNDRWLRGGSSIIFSPTLLTQLIQSDLQISLQEVLSWRQKWPSQPPKGDRTVLVVGLETCLELLDADEAYTFLCKTIRPFIIEFQSTWDQRGLVFGFNSSERQFKLDSEEQVIFKGGKNNAQIHLSNGLWNGAASDELYELIVPDNNPKTKIRGGFYVTRLS